MSKRHAKHHEETDTVEAATGSTKSLHEKLNVRGPLTIEEVSEHPAYLELQKKLEEAEEKSAQNWDKAVRLQAEMDNLRRRVERDIENAHKYALEKFVLELLPIIDSLERCISVEKVDTALLEGVELTLKMFNTALEKFGVKQINPESELFNPELHQAVSTLVDDNNPPGTVVTVLQKGYLLNNRLIRPALVIVSKSGVEN